MEVVLVPAFQDNYIFLCHTGDNAAFVVDPGDAAPVLAEAARRGWAISAVLNTHWHPDHTGGNAEIVARTGAPVYAPAGELPRIPTATDPVCEGDSISVNGVAARVLDVPGHTAGHIAYHFAGAGNVFVGDTLFALGCGRLFEGTAEQMWASLGKLMALPDETRVYCAHEYTEANARFAAHVEPDNAALAARIADIAATRARGEPTVPSSIALERATNPFTRAADSHQFAERRAAKDSFRG